MCTGRWLGREGVCGAGGRKTNQNPYGFLTTFDDGFPTLMMRVFFTISWCPFVMELNTHQDQELENSEQEMQ